MGSQPPPAPWATTPALTGTPTPTARSVLFGLGLYRTVTALWAVTVAIVDARSGVLENPSFAFAVLGPVLAWSLAATWLSRVDPQVLLRPAAQSIDMVLGAAVVIGESVVYSGEHPLTFGSLWQLAPILSAGVAYGLTGGLLAGAALGILSGISGALEEGVEGRALTTLSALVLYCVAGAAAGAMMDRLRRAEDAVAEARARERIAQTLHDGVLQTLAVIQRRSSDAELVDLAAKQDRELRLWITHGADPHPGGMVDITSSVAALVAELTERDRIPIQLVVVDAPPPADSGTAEVLLGAIREAATNAAKHADPERITVFIDSEESGTIRCEVRDNGTGMRSGAVEEGFGITTSLRAPIEALGGSVSIRSTPGSGTVVEMSVP